MIAAEALGWIVWFHEQSHASRGMDGTPAEEIQAQLETFRMCDENKYTSFHAPGRPAYREIMYRLALKQPTPYRAIFTDTFQATLALK
jgi:hypothetical protein